MEQTFCGTRWDSRAIKWGEHLEVLYHPLDGHGMLLVGEDSWREQGLNRDLFLVTTMDRAGAQQQTQGEQSFY
jgi:hypothetical protein